MLIEIAGVWGRKLSVENIIEDILALFPGGRSWKIVWGGPWTRKKKRDGENFWAQSKWKSFPQKSMCMRL